MMRRSTGLKLARSPVSPGRTYLGVARANERPPETPARAAARAARRASDAKGRDDWRRLSGLAQGSGDGAPQAVVDATAGAPPRQASPPPPREALAESSKPNPDPGRQLSVPPVSFTEAIPVLPKSCYTPPFKPKQPKGGPSWVAVVLAFGAGLGLVGLYGAQATWHLTALPLIELGSQVGLGFGLGCLMLAITLIAFRFQGAVGSHPAALPASAILEDPAPKGAHDLGASNANGLKPNP